MLLVNSKMFDTHSDEEGTENGSLAEGRTSCAIRQYPDPEA